MTLSDVRQDRKARNEIRRMEEARLQAFLSEPRGPGRAHPPYQAERQGLGAVAFAPTSSESTLPIRDLPSFSGRTDLQERARKVRLTGNGRDRAIRGSERNYRGRQHERHAP